VAKGVQDLNEDARVTEIQTPRFSVRRLESDPSWLLIRALVIARPIVIVGTCRSSAPA
jgi:hypothetical protein